MLPGVHRVRYAMAGGRVAEYWYAWRGGPRIMKAVAVSDAALAAEVARLAPEAATSYRELVRPAPSDRFLPGLITAYLTGADGRPPAHLAHMAPRTIRDHRRHLDAARIDLADMEVAALNAKGARRAIMAWRDRYAGTPRTADARMEALSQVLTWAADRDLIEANPIKGWKRLYRVNRADVVWKKADLIKLLKGAPAPLRTAVLLALYTGLRGGDLVRLTWAHVGTDAIHMPTGKSRGKRVVIIPITARLRALLRVIGRREVGTVLTSSNGSPWTLHGLKTAMQRQRVAAGIVGLRFHDLRGTAATYFVRAGLPIPDVATILGWEPERAAALTSYVTAEAVAAGMLERLRRNRTGS